MDTERVEPVTASPSSIGRTYDRLNGLYSWLVGGWEAPTRTIALEMLAPTAGELIVDVGCGPGHALVDIGRRVRPDGGVIGIDIAPRMLARSARRVTRTALDGVVEVVRGDARALPIADGRVDAAYIAETLELFARPDMARVLDELRRVLTSDGRLCVVSMPRAGHGNSRFVRTYEWLYRNLPGYATIGCRPIYVESAISGAGFEIEATRELVRGGVWPLEIVVGRPA